MSELSDQFDKIVAAAKVLPLRYWADPVLSVVCDKIEDNEFGPQLEQFGRELLATMNDANGVGLAAPQVGVTKRMFVMLFPDHEKTMKPIVVCNPEIALMGATVPGIEGCLSVPGIRQQVYRAAEIRMEYKDAAGKSYMMPLLTELDARVAQHEFDHLNGIMFFDFKDKRGEYGARMTKQMAKSALRDWEKEKKKRGIL